MADMKTFSKRIIALAGRFDRNTNEAVKKTAIVVDQAVVLATPADTGRARSNWQVAVGVPIRTEIEPYAPGSALGVSESGNAGGAIAQGQLAVKGRLPGQPIYISNNLEYIVPLNEGHSQQAAAGFVEKAIQAGNAFLRKVRVLK